MRIIAFIFLLFGCSVVGFSQTNQGKSITINADSRLSLLQQKYIDSQNGKIKGYRVQIHFGNEKNKAKDIKSKFLSKHNDVHAYEIFDSPYFKVRVGDFRTKLEAYKFMQKIMGDFSASFIVTDYIELPEL